MNLNLKLPAKEQKYFNNDEIIYTAPTDISIDGHYKKGWFVVTDKEIFNIENGNIINKLEINKLIKFKAENGVGSGMLIAETQDGAMPFIRYSARHLSRFAFMARGVRLIMSNNPIRVESDELDTTCPKCGRGMPGTLSCPSCDGQKKSANLFLSLIKPHRLQLLFITLVMLLTTGSQLISQYIHRQFVDNVLVPGVGGLSDILYYTGMYAGFTAIIMASITVRFYLTSKLGADLSSALRVRLFKKVQDLSLSFLDKRKAGELLTRILYDTDEVRRFITDSFGWLIGIIITFIGAFIIMLLMDWQLTLLTIIFVPIIMLAAGLFWRYINRIFYAQWRKREKINTRLQDVLSGIRVVKSYGKEKSENERFQAINDDFTETQIRNEKFWSVFYPLINLLFSFSSCLIVFFGGRRILGDQMSIGELAQFSAYAGILYGPLGWMTFLPRQIMQMLTCMQRISDILDEKPSMERENVITLDEIKGDVKLDNISFGYHSYEPVLENISLDVKKGEMIGIVGSSGAGKSTLINLIMRLYDVDEGRILIDGVDLKNINPASFHNKIGVVLQETFLFSGTVLENIRFSSPNSSINDIIKAAKVANAHDFICKMPDGYNTKIGEHGFNVSGGERQRIAIARAILNNPSILILDEATSALDTENEYQIQEALSRLIKGRTTFSIAHRLSTLRNADRIMVIDNHKCAEIGSHNELLKQKGIYYNLVMAQLQMKTKSE